MKHPARLNGLAWTALCALLLSVTTLGFAQTAKTTPAKMPPHSRPAPDMMGMMGMMGGPHQVLAMAYGENLATFARALRGQVRQAKSVNLEVARPATSEMRRSYDQMREHHQAHMKLMGDTAKAPMSAKMARMDKHLSALDEHLTALESEIASSMPDYRKVSEHTGEILELCGEMSAMHNMSKPHTMK